MSLEKTVKLIVDKYVNSNDYETKAEAINVISNHFDSDVVYTVNLDGTDSTFKSTKSDCSPIVLAKMKLDELIAKKGFKTPEEIHTRVGKIMEIVKQNLRK